MASSPMKGNFQWQQRQGLCVAALYSSFWWRPDRKHNAKVMRMPSFGALSTQHTQPPASGAPPCRLQMLAVRCIDAWGTSRFAGILASGLSDRHWYEANAERYHQPFGPSENQ